MFLFKAVPLEHNMYILTYLPYELFMKANDGEFLLCKSVKNKGTQLIDS